MFINVDLKNETATCVIILYVGGDRMIEEFRDIEGFEGRYQVSNLGNVKSLNYIGTKRAKNLKPCRHHLGYMVVALGAKNWKMVHTLVAKTFIPNPENKPFVNHIDGNKQNNNVTNLEWVTSKENMNHAIRTGLRNPHQNNKPRGGENPTSKPVLQLSCDGQLVKRWDCISDAARYLGCNSSQIVNTLAGRHKTCYGFLWRRPEE